VGRRGPFNPCWLKLFLGPRAEAGAGGCGSSERTGCAGTARQRCCSISLSDPAQALVGSRASKRWRAAKSVLLDRQQRFVAQSGVAESCAAGGETSAAGGVMRVLRACVMRSEGSQKAERRKIRVARQAVLSTMGARGSRRHDSNKAVAVRSTGVLPAIWLSRAKLQARGAQLERAPRRSSNARTAGNRASIAGFQFRFHGRRRAYLGPFRQDTRKCFYVAAAAS
jgi:hypothetical protein